MVVCKINNEQSVNFQGQVSPAEEMRHLLVQELAGVLLDVLLVQVGGQVHQTDLGQAKVCELDVAHGCDQQAREGKADTFI